MDNNRFFVYLYEETLNLYILLSLNACFQKTFVCVFASIFFPI